MLKRPWMGVVWPAFLAACVLELLVFGLIDPHELHWAGQPLGLSRLAAYTLAFFVFWAMCVVSSGLTVLLLVPPPGGHASARPGGTSGGDTRD